MELEITPEPSPEERRAMLAALERDDGVSSAYRSRWRAAALEELRGDPAAEDPGRDAGVVEP